MLKLQPNFDAQGSKFGRSFDQISTPPSRNFNPLKSNFHTHFCKIYIVKHQIQQQTSTPVCVETSTVGCRNLVETSTKLRPLMVELWLKLQPNFDTLSHRLVVNAIKNHKFTCQPNYNDTHAGICNTAAFVLNYNIALSTQSCTLMNRRLISCPMACALM